MRPALKWVSWESLRHSQDHWLELIEKRGRERGREGEGGEGERGGEEGRGNSHLLAC